MNHYYRHGEKAEHRRIRADVVIALLIILVVVVVAVFLFFDVRQESVVNDENNRPQVLNAVAQEEETTVFTEATFELTLPGLWEEATPDHQSERGSAGHKQLHYKSVEPGQEGRLVDVFVDNIPKEEPVSKLLPVSIEGNKIVPGELSDQCKTFTNHDKYGRKLTAVWQNRTFFCNTSSYANTIGIAVENMDDGVVLRGPDSGEHTYLIIFTDHSRTPANSMFNKILQDFRVL